VAANEKRRTATRTFVLEQSIQSVWKMLVNPEAPMWLTPKAAYVVAPPKAAPGIGELRCCWVHRWKKGIRQQTVWELIRVDPGRRVTYLDRSGPGSVTFDFQLAAEASGTRVDLVYQKPSLVKDRLLGHDRHWGQSENPMTRLIAAAGGDPPMPISGQVMTWTPGNGAREQINQIVISAPPKRVWTIVEDTDATLVPGPLRLASWRTRADGDTFTYSVTQLPSGRLVAGMARIVQDGPYRMTTINSDGVEIAHELLPHDEECLLRTTYRWTALIKAKAIRAGAQARLAGIKTAAESPSG
jgi:uncharacterized protein YndB with AHSA1/START domain